MNPINPGNFKRPEGNVRVSRPADDMGGEDMGSMAPAETAAPRSRRSMMGPWILVITIVIVLAVLGVVFRDRLFAKNSSAGSAEFQAVFLTNGQVYFGKISNTAASYVTLEDIYYLQVTPVLQTKTEGQPGQQANSQQQQLSLVKLGNELHAPVDKMQINRDQILFFEDLKDDGRVVKAIHDYETSNKK